MAARKTARDEAVPVAPAEPAAFANLRPLPRPFFARKTVPVARDLLGKLIVQTHEGFPRRAARIVEVEAYLGERDLASHARRGPTPRASIMFGPPGYLYVYLIYGMYHCMNFVTERDGEAGAVLIRAAEPVFGFDGGGHALLAGPGKLCRGFEITRLHKGLDLCAPTADFFVAADDAPARAIARSARIGVDYAGIWSGRLLRFFIASSKSVSRMPKPKAKERSTTRSTHS